MFSSTDGTYTGTTAAVRNGKCFMQIKVTYISSDRTGIGQSNLSIHISAIQVNKSTVCVNCGTHIFDGCFENTMRGRIGNHTSGKFFSICGCFFVPVGNIHISFFITFHHHNFKSALVSTGWIGAVGR